MLVPSTPTGVAEHAEGDRERTRRSPSASSTPPDEQEPASSNTDRHDQPNEPHEQIAVV